MKFLCISDQIDPLVYSTSVKDRYGDVDAVFCAGDLSMDYVDFVVDTLKGIIERLRSMSPLYEDFVKNGGK